MSRRNGTPEANGVIQVKTNKARRMFFLENIKIFVRKTVGTVYLSPAIRTKLNRDTACDVPLKYIPSLQTTEAQGSVINSVPVGMPSVAHSDQLKHACMQHVDYVVVNASSNDG